jgi:hypothetical protein
VVKTAVTNFVTAVTDQSEAITVILAPDIKISPQIKRFLPFNTKVSTFDSKSSSIDTKVSTLDSKGETLDSKSSSLVKNAFSFYI